MNKARLQRGILGEGAASDDGPACRRLPRRKVLVGGASAAVVLGVGCGHGNDGDLGSGGGSSTGPGTSGGDPIGSTGGSSNTAGSGDPTGSSTSASTTDGDAGTGGSTSGRTTEGDTGSQAEPDCIEACGGTLVDLGNADDKETTTELSEGGNARYDASGIIASLRWLNEQGCSGPNRSSTTQQFLFRWNADHDGGCISGGAIYGNLTPDDNYDAGDGKTWQLYPCSDGGQLYVRRPGGRLTNFTLEAFRLHGCWDPIRLSAAGREVVDNITVKGCWGTCVRDDFVENDTGRNLVISETLVGDTIGQNSGCWVFYSTTGGNGFKNIVEIRDCLIWSSLMRSNRIRDIDGYTCGSLFKLDRQTTPRIHMHNTVIMADHLNISSNGGDPLGLLKAGSSAPAPLAESSNNILIWRDLGGIGTDALMPLPPGFTLLTGSEGESYWNEQVAAWKAAHPNVRRLDKTGIARPFLGGTTSVVDQG